MAIRTNALLIVGLCLGLASGMAAAQQKPDDIPDAPSATRPIPPEPNPPLGGDQGKQPPNGEGSGNDVTSGSQQLPHSVTETSNPNGPPPPMPPVKTVPAGGVPKDAETGEDVGYTLKKVVNLVLVPVTVKNSDGHLVNGLQSKDFTVFENGQKQLLKFFTSDPFALSAAVIIDLGLPEVALHKVQQTLSALQGAFSQWDEIGIYTYSSRAGRVADFTMASRQVTAALDEVRNYSGVNNGPPVTGGPLGPEGPIINGMPIGPPVTPVITPPREAHVLNDAILLAARDLSKRPKDRRKIIFVISDGRELGSTASYKDTLKVLLTQNITLYAVGIDGASIPVYDRLQRIHLPKSTALLGYSDILPKYVAATGGGNVYGGLSQQDIELAYSKAIGEARNQYTLGYSPKGIGGYREIEVRVRCEACKIEAKYGYYPLPTAQ